MTHPPALYLKLFIFDLDLDKRVTVEEVANSVEALT
jgi:hypothetical protein